VKIGPPAYNGGSLVTDFNIEWDSSPNFDSGTMYAPEGSVTKSAYTNLCQDCVTHITFSYENNEMGTVTYTQGTDNIVRQLQPGVRVSIVTKDVHYQP